MKSFTLQSTQTADTVQAELGTADGRSGAIRKTCRTQLHIFCRLHKRKMKQTTKSKAHTNSDDVRP